MQNITITYIGNHWTMKIKRGIGSDCFYIFSSFHRHPFLNSVLKTSLFLKHLHFLSIKIVHCYVFQYTMITSAIKRVKVDWIRNKMRQKQVSTYFEDVWDVFTLFANFDLKSMKNLIGFILRRFLFVIWLYINFYNL